MTKQYRRTSRRGAETSVSSRFSSSDILDVSVVHSFCDIPSSTRDAIQSTTRDVSKSQYFLFRWLLNPRYNDKCQNYF